MKNNDFIKETANEIIKALENSTAPWIKPWKANQLRDMIPFNPTTQKEYAGINFVNLVIKSYEKGYDDPRWLTYNQAKNMNAQVKKGEKSTLIQYWQWTKEVDKLDENGKPIINEFGKKEKELVKLETPSVFYANVFNAKQIDNMPTLEVKPVVNEFKVIQTVENILKNSGANIIHKGNEAFYTLSNDTITLPPKQIFDTESGYYATALHELGHWTGHKSRLDRRDLNSTLGTMGYAKEELRAEISSFMQCAKLGLDYDPSDHISYIKSWVKILKDTPTEIFKATSDATKIINFVNEFNSEKNQIITHEKDLAKFEKDLGYYSKNKDILHANTREDLEKKLISNYNTLTNLGVEFDDKQMRVMNNLNNKSQSKANERSL